MLFEDAHNDDGYHQDGASPSKNSKKEKIGYILLGLCLLAGALMYLDGNSEKKISMIDNCEIERRQIQS